MIKKIILLMLALLMIGPYNLIAEENEKANYKPLSNYDPFEEDLQTYYNWREIGSTILFYSSCALLSGFVASTTAKTCNSLGYLDTQPSQVIEYSSYGTIIVSSITGFIAFLIWKNNSDKYLETLQLQTRYYNLLR